MNKTVTISTFAGILSRQSGYTSEFCEQFVAEMFRTVADALKDNDEVSIKGLGRFAVDDNGNVSFVPDDSFASEVNAPFECFEPEPLDDYVTEELLDGDEINSDEDVESDAVVETIESEVISEIAPTEEAEPATEETVETETSTEVMTETQPDIVVIESVPDKEVETSSELESNSTSDPSCDTTLLAGQESISETTPTENDVVYPQGEETEAPARKGRVWSFVCGVALGAVLGAAVTYFIVAKVPSSETGEQIAAQEQLVAEDFGETEQKVDNERNNGESNSTLISAENTNVSSQSSDPDMEQGKVSETKTMPETKPEKETKEVVYDTVTTTLSQLSRKHYGSYHFWVYIYDENKDVIENPDLVEPGTRLRIPSREKYGIDYKNKESINNALKRAQEIANSFKR